MTPWRGKLLAGLAPAPGRKLQKAAPVLRAYLRFPFQSFLSALLTFMPMFLPVWSSGPQGTCSEGRVPGLVLLPCWLWRMVVCGPLLSAWF